MARLHELHVQAYARLVGSLPPRHRKRHGSDQVQLFADLIATGTPPWRLWVRAVSDVLWIIREQADERKVVMSVMSRFALVPLSAVSLVAGSTLMAAALGSSVVRPAAAIPAAAIALQGLFTLLWLGDRLGGLGGSARMGFVIGESAALVIGGVALAGAIVVQSASGDPEYGPLTLLTIVVVHAAVGLLFVAMTDRDGVTSI
jgi:hypothetical protein